MTDEWRRKSFYETRVMVETERVIASLVPDSLVCLTGGQLEMLRNLTQYLHRRSTFASEYLPNGYLCPSNEEWAEVQLEVAELELVLMGCPDIVAALNSIAAQVACLCQKATHEEQWSPATQLMIGKYVNDGALVYPDVDASQTVEDPVRCATAQLAWQQSWELLTEYIQPTQAKTVDILLPSVMVALAVWVGTPVLGIPVGVLLALLWNVIDVWVEGELASVANQLFSAREELVCAVYEGLTISFQAAHDAAASEINSWEGFSTIDKIVMRALFAPWLIKLAGTAWANQTSWATTNVTSGYCLMCPSEGILGYDVTWPPCENSIFVGCGFCSETELKCAFNLHEEWINHLEQEFYLGNPLLHSECNSINIILDWYSAKPNENWAGWLRFQKWDAVNEVWIEIINHHLATDSPDPLVIATHTDYLTEINMPAIGQLCRVQILVSAIQGPIYPTDIMLGRFQMILELVLI